LLVVFTAISEFTITSLILVHLRFLWVGIESTAVEVDGCFEVFEVAIASNLPFDLHDLAMDSLCHCIGDAYAHGEVQVDEGGITHPASMPKPAAPKSASPGQYRTPSRYGTDANPAASHPAIIHTTT
jgi:hypothetical protein